MHSVACCISSEKIVRVVCSSLSMADVCSLRDLAVISLSGRRQFFLYTNVRFSQQPCSVRSFKLHIYMLSPILTTLSTPSASRCRRIWRLISVKPSEFFFCVALFGIIAFIKHAFSVL